MNEQHINALNALIDAADKGLTIQPGLIKAARNAATQLKDTTHNGWTNYETWLVNLWMDNDEGSQKYWAEQAKRALDDAQHTPSANFRLTGREPFTTEERAGFTLEAVIKATYEGQCEQQDLNGWMADLMTSALGEVNWHEIAAALIDANKPDRDRAGAMGMEAQLGIN